MKFFAIFAEGEGYKMEGTKQNGKKVSMPLTEDLLPHCEALSQAMNAYIDEEVAEVLQQLADANERYLALIETYPEWKEGKAVKKGERYRYDGELFEVIQAHTTQATWAPDTAPSLFKLAVGGLEDEEGEIILDFVQPTGAHDAYQKGDKIKWTDGKIYESTIANNVYSPTAYPQGWKVVEG